MTPALINRPGVNSRHGFVPISLIDYYFRKLVHNLASICSYTKLYYYSRSTHYSSP